MATRAGGGQTVTLRRRHTLANGVTGAPITALAMAGAALLGAQVISLDAANLTGSLPAGCVLAIAGVTGTYTTASATTAASGALSSVALTTALAGAAANDAVVTISQPYGPHTFRAARGGLSVEEVGDASQATGQARRYHLSAIGADTAPAVGDLVVDGTVEQVVRMVRARQPGAEVHGWVIEVGDAA